MLSHVFARVVLRVELGPPVAEVPPIEGIKVCFVRPHNFDVDADISVAFENIARAKPQVDWQALLKGTGPAVPEEGSAERTS